MKTYSSVLIALVSLMLISPVYSMKTMKTTKATKTTKTPKTPKTMVKEVDENDPKILETIVQDFTHKPEKSVISSDIKRFREVALEKPNKLNMLVDLFKSEFFRDTK